jgi:uncharacterized protein (DUF885 family)
MPKYRSEIFEIIEKYSDASYEYDPIAATYAGKKEYNDGWNDYTYHSVDPFLRVAKATRNKLIRAQAIDKYDEIARKVLLADLDRYINDTDSLFTYTYWGGNFHPLDDIVSVFHVMPKDTKKDVLNITKRMEGIPKLTVEWISALKDVAKLGEVNAKKRVEWAVESILNQADGSFIDIAQGVDPENKRLMRAAKEAEVAFEQTAAWLSHCYIPMCSDDWRMGEERYVRSVEGFTGLVINPHEVYEFGLSEMARINKEMWEVARKLKPDATSLVEVADWLNNNEDYIIHGPSKLKAYLESITKSAIKDLSAAYFTIPVAIRKCEVTLDATTIDESPYYMSPSDDLVRPGSTIYPTLGREDFTIWENVSTWYHESVPGHHMQIATSVLNKETLTTYQRGDGWNSGYGEGWALYSETLMNELGYFSDLGHKMGYLMCQAMRAARLVVDIGLHLGYEVPEGMKARDGEVWSYSVAIKYMTDQALLKRGYAENEVKRYICWGGQAVSYKLGERIWMQAREDAKKRHGDKFNIKKFHMYALNLGPMGLGALKEELDKF